MRWRQIAVGLVIGAGLAACVRPMSPAAGAVSPPSATPAVPTATLPPAPDATQQSNAAAVQVQTVGHYENTLIVVLAFPQPVQAGWQVRVNGRLLVCTQQEGIRDRLYCSGEPLGPGPEQTGRLELIWPGQSAPFASRTITIPALPTPIPAQSPAP